MSRKRAGGKIKATLDDKTAADLTAVHISPLVQQESLYFKELVDSSNDYTKLMQQKAQYKYIVSKLEEHRKNIQTGKIKLPITLALIPKVMYYQEGSKKAIFKILDEQITAYKKNISTLTGQIEHRYENYVESAVRNREFLAKRFANAKAKQIVGVRDLGEKEEEDLFEADFRKLAKDPELQKKFAEAEKEAIKRNVARKTKSKTTKKVKA